ncbi:unnamed protein product [Moneuplotes crassus]|uniref:Uncharacterized protein n=1 Tax=Euplotes crassus TaxID=5936 RepID=A0AAD1UA84_EUPCR|nr:unnamed protein product [Moneuplotes crassus]
MLICNRFQCSDLACKRHGEYFCRTHQMCTCKGCASNMHFKCELVITQDLTDINIYAVEVKRFVERLSKLTAENGLGAYNSHIDNELKDLGQPCCDREENKRCNYSCPLRAICHPSVSDQTDPNPDVCQHYRQRYSLLFNSQRHYHVQSAQDCCLLIISYQNKKKIDAVVKENAELMEKKLLSKSKQIEQQCKAELTEEFKDEINSLEDFKTQLEEDLKVKLEEIKESKLQHDKDQEEISKLCEEVKESQGQLEETTEALNYHLTDICKDFDPNSKDLTLDMTDGKCQKLVKTMGDFRYPLGDMNELSIDLVGNKDAALKTFMTNSSLSSLKSFVFNDSYKGAWDEEASAVKVKYYVDGLKKVLPHVTKEVYLNRIIADADDLSLIVKLSSNAERLTVRLSKILTSDSLDFTSPTPSKITYLSFFNCGHANWSNQEWDKYPDRFEKIIIAIKNSSLKDSLKTLNLKECKISISKATSLLSTHGLPHISVIQEVNCPISL